MTVGGVSCVAKCSEVTDWKVKVITYSGFWPTDGGGETADWTRYTRGQLWDRSCFRYAKMAQCGLYAWVVFG